MPLRSAAPTPAANDPDGDSDRRIVLRIAPIEGEDPHRPADDRATYPQRPGGRSTKARPSAAATPGISRHPRPQLLERQRRWGVRRARARRPRGSRSCPAAAASPPRRRPGAARAAYVSLTVVPGRTVPMLRPERASPWASGLRPPTSRSGLPFSVVVPLTYVSGGGGSSLTTTSLAGSAPLVRHRERDRRPLSRRAARSAPEIRSVESEVAAERGREHPLHVERERGDRPLRHRRARAVDEEEDAGEQTDAERHADQRGKRPARIAQQVAPDVAKHRTLRRSRPSRRRTVPSSRRATAGSWVTTTRVAPESALGAQQEVDHRRRVVRVQRAGGLVGEDHAGPVDQRARDRHALTLPAGQLIGQLVGVVGKPQLGEQLEAALVAVAGAMQRELQAHVLDRGEERQQVVGLEHEPELVTAQTSALARRAGSEISRPPIDTRPAVGASRPAIRPSSVDLPQPLGPVMARLVPGCTSRVIPSTARTSPAGVE